MWLCSNTNGDNSFADWTAGDRVHSLLAVNEADSMLFFVVNSAVPYLVTLFCNGLTKSSPSSARMSHLYLARSWLSSFVFQHVYRVRTFHVPKIVLPLGSLMIDVACVPVASLYNSPALHHSRTHDRW